MSKRKIQDSKEEYESEYEGLTSSDEEEDFASQDNIPKKIKKVNAKPISKKSHSSVDSDEVNNKLIYAVEDWQATNAQKALNKGANINLTVGENNNSLLMLAIENYQSNNHKSKLINILLANKINMNAQNKNGDTALMMAAKKGLWVISEELIKAGADTSIANNDKLLARHVLGQDVKNLYIFKSKQGYELIKDLLLKKEGMSAEMHQAELDAINNNSRELLRNSITNSTGSKLNQRLIDSVKQGHSRNIKQLVKEGADINVLVDSNKNTLLMSMIENGKYNNSKFKLIQELIDAKIDIDAKNKNGDTAVILAAEKGSSAIVKQLIDNGANTRIKNNDGIEALYLVGKKGGANNSCPAIIKALQEKSQISDKEYNSNLGEISKTLSTLGKKSLSQQEQNKLNDDLIKEVQKWHLANVKKLIMKGADIHIKVGADNNSLLIHAVENNITQSSISNLIGELVDMGIDIDAKNNNGDTALITAAKTGCPSLVTKLLDAGANPDIENNDKKKALDLVCSAVAKRGHKQDIINKLQSVVTEGKNSDEEGLTSSDEEDFVPQNNIPKKIKASSPAEKLRMLAEKLMYNNSGGQKKKTSKSKKSYSSVDADDINGALIEAVTNWKARHIEQFVKDGADMEALVGPNKNTLLMLAIENYVDKQHFQLKVIEKLIAANVSLNAQNDNGDTALIMAAKKGYWRIIEKLIAAKADPTIVNNTQKKAIDLIGEEADLRSGTKSKIHDALDSAEKSFNNSGEALAGPAAQKNINLKLLDAVKKWEIFNIRKFLSQGADIHIKVGENNDSLLMVAIENYHSKNSTSVLIKELVNSGVDIDVQNDNGDTALIIAAKQGMLTMARHLLDLGANPKLQNNEGIEAVYLVGLERGSNTGNAAMKKILLEKMNISDAEYQIKLSKVSKIIHRLDKKSLSLQEQQKLNDALVDSVQKWHANKVKKYINQGAKIDIKIGKNNNNLLMHAVENYNANSNSSSLLQDLLNVGICINSQNDNGDTALIIAAKRGLFTTVSKLLDAGANSNIQNKDKKKALDLVCTEGGGAYKKQIINKLLSVTEQNNSDSDLEDNQTSDSDEEDFVNDSDSDNAGLSDLDKDISDDSDDEEDFVNDSDNDNEGLSDLDKDISDDSDDEEDFVNDSPDVHQDEQEDESMKGDEEGHIGDEDFFDKSLIDEVQNWKTITSSSTNYNILVGEDENTLLMHAIENYQTTNFPRSRLTQLIKKGIDINAQNKNGDTALIIAAKSGKLSLIKHLISLKADPTIKNNEGHDALSLIKEETNKLSPKFTDYLQATSILRKKINAYNKKASALQQAEETSTQNLKETTILNYESDEEEDEDYRESSADESEYISSGEEVDDSDDYNWDAFNPTKDPSTDGETDANSLNAGVLEESDEEDSDYLDASSDEEYVDSEDGMFDDNYYRDGWDESDAMTDNNESTISDPSTDGETDDSMKDESATLAQNTICNIGLIYAVENWTNLPKIKEGFDGLIGENNDTLLMLAVENYKNNMPAEARLKFLVNKGIDVNAQNKNGDTALTIAAKKGFPEIIKVLLKLKADPNIENNDGNSALYLLKPETNPNLIGYTNYLQSRNLLLKKTKISLGEYEQKLALLCSERTTEEQIIEESNGNNDGDVSVEGAEDIPAPWSVPEENDSNLMDLDEGLLELDEELSELDENIMQEALMGLVDNSEG